MKSAAAAVLLAFASSSHAAVVFSTNFESETIPVQITGAGNLSSTGGLSAFGFGQVHLNNNTTSPTLLNLIGLSPHNTITLTFDLAMWDSIDLGGDQFVILADGVTLYTTSTDFGNYFPADNIGHGPGNLLTPGFESFAVPDFGQNASYRDSARHVSFTFPHTAENLTVSWAFPNSQGGTDESFGLDNISVDATTVPEPSVWAFCLAGTMGLLRRRR